MGVLSGGLIKDADGKEYKYMLIWGKVVRSANVMNYQKKDGSFSRKTTFTVKYHNNPRQYMNCTVWGTDELSDVAGTLEEQKDYVLVAGKWSTFDWFNKKTGETKKLFDLNCEIIFSQSILGFAAMLAGSRKIENLLNNVKDDPMESADDFKDDEDYGVVPQEDDYQINI